VTDQWWYDLWDDGATAAAADVVNDLQLCTCEQKTIRDIVREKTDY
jgi:hypothetical protein